MKRKFPRRPRVKPKAVMSVDTNDPIRIAMDRFLLKHSEKWEKLYAYEKASYYKNPSEHSFNQTVYYSHFVSCCEFLRDKNIPSLALRIRDEKAGL